MYNVRNKPQYDVRDTNDFVRADSFGVSLPIPLGGIDKSKTSRTIKPAHVFGADNSWISDDGFLEMMGGYESFSNELGDRNLMIAEFNVNPTTKKFLYAYGDDTKGYIGYFDTDGTFNELDDTLDKDEKIGFCSYINDKGSEIVADTTATSGTATTIAKTGAGWMVDAYKGKIVKLLSGTGSGQYRQILSNTTDTITIKDIDFETAPDNTTHFTILELGNSFYFKQKGTDLWEYNGTTITKHGNKPKGNAIYIWQERMIIGGADDMVVQVSKPLNVLDFTGEGSFFGNIGSENGQLQTAFLQLPQNRIAIFKEDSYQIVNGITGTVELPIIDSENISQAIGCCGIRAITEIPETGAIVVSKDKKIYPFGYLKNVLSGIVGEHGEISNKVKLLLNIDNDSFDDVFVSHDKLQNKVWFSFQVDSVVKTLVFDLERKSLIPFWFSSNMNIEEVVNYNGETYMTLGGTGQVVKFTPDTYTRLGEDYVASITFKDWAGNQTNPKLFDRIIFSLKNTIGSFLCKARISDSSDIHQLSTSIPMGEVDLGGGSGGAPSGFIPSGGSETVYDIQKSQFIKRRFNLDEIVGVSLEIEISSDDFFSFGEISISGENLSEDEEDPNIQF